MLTPTKAQRVLEFIGTNPDGRTLKEIQTFILKMNDVQKWLERGYLAVNPKTGEIERTPKGRGYWTDYLYGTSYYAWSREGMLHTHCVKLPTGRWKLVEKPVGPFRGKETKALQFNKDTWRGARERYLESLPECAGCEVKLHPGSSVTPTDDAHFTMQARGYSTDCLGRVWWSENVNDWNAPKHLTKMTKIELAMLEDLSEKLEPDYVKRKDAVWRELHKWVKE